MLLRDTALFNGVHQNWDLLHLVVWRPQTVGKFSVELVTRTVHDLGLVVSWSTSIIEDVVEARTVVSETQGHDKYGDGLILVICLCWRYLHPR